VEACDFVVDGGVFESGIEDVDRLVSAGHWQSSFWSLTASRWLPKREEGVKATGVAVVETES